MVVSRALSDCLKLSTYELEGNCVVGVVQLQKNAFYYQVHQTLKSY